MDTEFGILPWLLLIAIAALLGHSIAGRYWRVISKIGVLSISIAIAISWIYTKEQIGVEGGIFYTQVACFFVFLFVVCTVFLKTVFEVFRTKSEE